MKKERVGKGEGIVKYEKKRQNMKGWEREKEQERMRIELGIERVGKGD